MPQTCVREHLWPIDSTGPLPGADETRSSDYPTCYPIIALLPAHDFIVAPARPSTRLFYDGCLSKDKSPSSVGFRCRFAGRASHLELASLAKLPIRPRSVLELLRAQTHGINLG